jgi:hypothetical protein
LTSAMVSSRPIVAFRAGARTDRVHTGFGFRFDRAVGLLDGSYTVVYGHLGTKAVLLKQGTFLRELNRSFYCAEAYEYPVAVFKLVDGRAVIAHCPDEYNIIHIEDADTGERLTARAGEPKDIFHSRLAASPDGRTLISAGWFWHPYGVLDVFDLGLALEDPSSLDGDGLLTFEHIAGEVQSACFVDDDHILIATDPIQERRDEPVHDLTRLGQGELGCWSLSARAFVYRTPIGRSLGTIMPVGDRQAVAFFEHPQLIDCRTGAVLEEWGDIANGRQTSSIVSSRDNVPILALDAAHRRFAVADDDGITIVEVPIDGSD